MRKLFRYPLLCTLILVLSSVSSRAATWPDEADWLPIEGTQTNLQFVPVQSSDFIFTAVGEQFGFVGSMVVLGLFGVMLFRLLMIALNARSRFSYLTVIGIASMLAFHVFINIGMTVRVMPVTGLPLPFMSAGGTVFVALSAALGLAHSAWIRRNMTLAERPT